MTDSRYAVVGQPVAHSKSPQIHHLFAKQTGENLHYEAIAVEPADFADFVRDFFAAGGAGLNITLPHKEAAHALAESLTPRARLAGAVNTLLINTENQFHGDNTDGTGLVRDIQENLGFAIANKAVLILGAGGAARGALPALLDQQPGSVTVVNRTRSRAEAIQRDFRQVAAIAVSDYTGIGASSFDLIINATSMSLDGAVPPLPPQCIAAGACCYDMMYADTETAFVTWANRHGAALAADGLGMLVEQAAESFFLWRGLRPQTQPVINALRGSV